MEFYDTVKGFFDASAWGFGANSCENAIKKADEVIKAIEGLNRPHGIAFKDSYMYVAQPIYVSPAEFFGKKVVCLPCESAKEDILRLYCGR